MLFMFNPTTIDPWERSIRLAIDYLIMLAIIDNFLILALGKDFISLIWIIDLFITLILFIVGLYIVVLTKKKG